MVPETFPRLFLYHWNTVFLQRFANRIQNVCLSAFRNATVNRDLNTL